MKLNLTRKLIQPHLASGMMVPGEEIGIIIDQTLTQDSAGTLVMLELEAMGLDRVRTEVSAQYVDHNLIQEDYRNADDHLFLRSACRRFGVWYSRPGNGVSHPCHQEYFGKPGKTLLGGDSHTPAAGALGMLAIGAGGLEVALAMAGEPFFMRMPHDQTGCNGCIGMGQAPATHALSLRTVPRNFPGRSGTREDQVCLVSPETATASALTGKITDPRTLGMAYPRIADPDHPVVNRELFVPPLPPETASQASLEKGPNIASLPTFEPLPEVLEAPVLLKAGDDVSTDDIMPAGLRVLPYRSNIPKIAEFSFERIDPAYAKRARQVGSHIVVGGRNYGQGSSREHAALGPRFLGLRAVLAKGFARIHAQNLVNFGVLPLVFIEGEDYGRIQAGDVLRLTDLVRGLDTGTELTVENLTRRERLRVRHVMSPRQVQILRRGGLINWMGTRLAGA